MIDRRSFLKSLLAITASTLSSKIKLDEILSETSHLSDDEFVAYFKFSMNLIVHNPANSAMISNIN